LSGATDVDEYDVAERIVRNKLEIQRLTEENTALSSFFRQDDPKTKNLERDGRPTIIVKVIPNQRIDDGLAKRELSATEYKTVSKQTVDTAKARALLSAAKLEKITKRYDNKVEVSLA